jgi:DNA-binding response OmpR family regulator
MERILVVDDDVELCELLSGYLEPEGFQVEMAHDGVTGLDAACRGDYELIVLDVMLPEANGFDVLSRLRSQMNTPVIMLTARGDEVDRIVGLEMGADDYMPKPFNPRELVARIRAVLRRTKLEMAEQGQHQAVQKVRVGDVEIDAGTRVVLRSGEAIDLTSVEFNILEMLVRRAGQLVSRSELVEVILGRPLSPYDRSIDVHVSKLRKKLGHEVYGLERIKSIRGVGYQYALVHELAEELMRCEYRG